MVRYSPLLVSVILAAPAWAAAAQPTPYAEAALGDELYRPPPVRPFEAPSGFGLEREQGDGEAAGARAPIDGPVVVDDYHGQYEYPPSQADTAYLQAVAEAEMRADGLMGALDGRWRAVDGAGRPVLELDLRDRGSGLRLDGAWRDLTAPKTTRRIGTAAGVRDPEGGVRLTLGDDASLIVAPDRRSARLERTEGALDLTFTPAD